jgi:hypothetical protein
MSKFVACLIAVVFVLAQFIFPTLDAEAAKDELKVGVAAVAITPFGRNADWDGTVTDSGVWGETFTDTNKNNRWDEGEPFTDDEGNTALDAGSKGKYDGIFLAGFGDNRIATGKYDDYWARAIVLESGTTKIAIVALDVIGYYSRTTYYGLEQIKKMLSPKLGISEILIASTHNHEAPDTIGAWGINTVNDGKYPKYLRFVDRQIAKAIAQAAASTQGVKMKLGRTDPQESPSIAGMQTRTGGRPPKFFDEELRVMQFVGLQGKLRDKTIATLVQWNTHPESMEDKNTMITSDFPHAVRDSIEKRYGGTCLYVSGDIGATEIIGDTNRKSTDRSTFDGKDYPYPIAKQGNIERTYGIGRDIAKAAMTAIDKGEWSAVNKLEVKKARFNVPMDNQGYKFLASKGVLDNGPEIMTEVEAWVYCITLGDAQMLTTPGELFPEVLYGVATYGRKDCPAAATGRPAEPSVYDRMTKKYKFILGLCPDEFGYIVPGSDFMPPKIDLNGMHEAEDPCKAERVPKHYHETNSSSSQLAPAWACTARQLLDGKVPDVEACRKP